MTPADGDWELLRRYAHQRDQAAFAQVVRRHVDLVFSAAMRRVGRREMAEDVTQAVFVILAAKARKICDGTGPLSAWLLQCVRYAAANAIKMEKRRRRHETAALRDVAKTTSAAVAAAGACSANPTDVLIWQEVAQQLDDAVLKLPAAYRQAVLLHYFENRAIAEIAAEMNVTEGAAKQRLSRAVEKLRQRLAKRSGAMMGAIDSAALSAMLASHAVRSAPQGLTSAAYAAAAATGGAIVAAGASGAGINVIAKGAMAMMTWAKIKLAAAAVFGVVVIGGAGGLVAVKNGIAFAADPAPAAAQAQTPPDEGKSPPAETEPAKGAEKDEEQKPNTVTLKMAPPVVVKTVPQAGAANVDPAIKEIRVTYSKAMADGSWSWSTWGEENFPKTTGKPRYDKDGKTCVLPVKLERGRTYAIWLNSNNFGNFKDADGNQAVPYLLVFETKK